MNGNRGAKGSIKDRLISILYRLRYKKKQLKEEYTVMNKQKKIKYLNNLKKFRETENLNILDKQDLNVLEKIKFDAKIKVGIDENFKPIKEKVENEKDDKFIEKKEIKKSSECFKKQVASTGVSDVKISNKINITQKKVDVLNPVKTVIPPVYDELDSKLSKIESKTDELNSPINIKQEMKKTNLEIIILKEVNTFIEKSKEDMDEIKNDVASLKIDIKNKNKDTKDLEEKYNKLKEKIETLKAKYDAVKEKYDFSDFYIFESIKLIDSIEDYKSLSSLNEIDMIINICKNEIKKIDDIVILHKDKNDIGNSMDAKKEEQTSVKIKFMKSKENVNNIKNIENVIYKELYSQEQIINEMYKEASYLKKNVSRQIETIGHRRILSSILNIAGGILTIPFTGKNLFGIALGETMINRGLKEMNRKLETRQRIIINYEYKDISNSIRKVKDKIEYINLVISDSLNEIKNLKENYKNIYSDYNELLPEYNIVLEKILTLEGILLNEQNRINCMDKKLDEENEMNKQKLKKIEDNK